MTARYRLFVLLTFFSLNLLVAFKPKAGFFDEFKKFNKRHALRILKNRIWIGEYWWASSDGDSIIYFNTIEEARRAEIIPIPTFAVSGNIDSAEFTQNILNYLHTEKSTLVGLVLKEEAPLCVLYVYKNRPLGIPVFNGSSSTGFLTKEDEPMIKFFRKYKHDSTLFFFTRLQTFCVIKEGRLFCWDASSGEGIAFETYIKRFKTLKSAIRWTTGNIPELMITRKMIKKWNREAKQSEK